MLYPLIWTNIPSRRLRSHVTGVSLWSLLSHIQLVSCMGRVSHTKVCAPALTQPSSVHTLQTPPYTPMCTHGREIRSQAIMHRNRLLWGLDEHSKLFGQEILGNPEDGVDSGQARGFGADHSQPVRRGTERGARARQVSAPKEYWNWE